MSHYFKLGACHSRAGVKQEKSEYGVKITIFGPCSFCGKRMQKTKVFYEQVDPETKVDECEIIARCRKRAVEWGRNYAPLHDKCMAKRIKVYEMVHDHGPEICCCVHSEYVWDQYLSDCLEAGIKKTLAGEDIMRKLDEAVINETVDFGFFQVKVKMITAKEYMEKPKKCGWNY
jgi:hypothetical protein